VLICISQRIFLHCQPIIFLNVETLYIEFVACTVHSLPKLCVTLGTFLYTLRTSKWSISTPRDQLDHPRVDT